jgi:uncharacterized protein (DUF2235 family)
MGWREERAMSTAAGSGAPFKTRNLVVLSDGTGNSAAKLFRTNVWRIYEALDLNCDDQVALYDDGVGTASFKPLAILGGAFGYGLKRNVLDLYMFLCRNYKAADGYHFDPDHPSADDPAKHDRIFVFGFSRGAFTARVVASLVANEGLIHRAATDAELYRLAKWAYRSYREKRYRNEYGVRILREIRDHLLRLLEWRKPVYDRKQNRDVPIDFLGVFDTVAAYGLPIDELTRGWDRWVWPITPRDNALHPSVKAARHAVAIDDERQTFFPLLWDEDSESEKQKNRTFKHPADRVKQVWFAGMHSNVGGGYADDALSLGPLFWMAGEAVGHGLRFQKGLRPSGGHVPDSWSERAAPCAPMGDSREGAGAYYRYHPRPIARLCGFKDHSTEPDPKSLVRIDRPKIHESVFERIRDSRDNYAPFALPEKYAVVTRTGELLAGDADATPPPAHPNPYEHSTEAASRVREQQRAWDSVWMRRVTYFLSIGATLLLLALPLLPLPTLLASNTLATALGAVEGFAPGFAQGWLDAYHDRPGWFFLVALIVAGLLRWGSHLKVEINDRMGQVWAKRNGLQASRLQEIAPEPTNAIYRLREHALYKGAFRFMSNTLWPHVFGIAMVLIILGGIPLRLAYQVASRMESFGTKSDSVRRVRLEIPGTTSPQSAADDASRPPVRYVSAEEVEFYPDEIFRQTGIQFTAGRRYAIQIAIPVDPEGQAAATAQVPDQDHGRRLGGWSDASRPVTSTAGIGSTAKLVPFLPFRRIWAVNWFVPIAIIGKKVPERHYLTEPVTEFTATRDGPLSLYVNDAAFPIGYGDGGLCLGWNCYYRNNYGGPARVRVTELDANTTARSLPPLAPFTREEQVARLQTRH